MSWILLSVFAATSLGAGIDQSLKQEAKRRIEQMERRFDDYFLRQKQQQEWEAKRHSGRKDLRSTRQKEKDRYEKWRQEFIKKRASKKTDFWSKPEAYEKYLLNKEKEKHLHKVHRQDFVEKREFMRHELDKADKKLSDYQEYGLDYED